MVTSRPIELIRKLKVVWKWRWLTVKKWFILRGSVGIPCTQMGMIQGFQFWIIIGQNGLRLPMFSWTFVLRKTGKWERRGLFHYWTVGPGLPEQENYIWNEGFIIFKKLCLLLPFLVSPSNPLRKSWVPDWTTIDHRIVLHAWNALNIATLPNSKPII